RAEEGHPGPHPACEAGRRRVVRPGPAREVVGRIGAAHPAGLQRRQAALRTHRREDPAPGARPAGRRSVQAQTRPSPAARTDRRREPSRSKTKRDCSTHRTYVLRSYLGCDLCDRRFWGATCRGHTYCLCRPPKDYVPEGHPQSIWVREDSLLKGVTEFFETDI